MVDPNAAIYFPRIKKANPLRGNQIEVFAPSGAIAGVIASTDRQRGVWKAPAGLDATLTGVYDFDVNLTDSENGKLNACCFSGPTGRKIPLHGLSGRQ